jgi:hypothetical protein
LEEECFEVRVSDMRRGKEILDRIPGVVSVEPAGSSLHLFLAPALTSAEVLEKAMAEAGCRSTEFRKIVPSLEDAFIALIRKSELSGHETRGTNEVNRG